jgi:alpha-N-arabinofuranosidase
MRLAAAVLGMALAIAACSGESTAHDPSGAGGSPSCQPTASAGCGLGGAGGAGGSSAVPGGAGAAGVTAGTGGAGGAAGAAGASGAAGAAGTSGAGGSGPVTLDCDESAIGASPSTLGVSAATAEQVIHNEIFGVLLEILGRNIDGGVYVGAGSPIPNTNGIRNDIIEGFREAGVGAIQWPGGCAANDYDWQANLRPTNTIGTDLFMQLCEAVGAEPFLVGRPRPEFAQSNRDWVSYVNDNDEHPEWNLRYFKVGNEVWGCGGDLGDDLATYETWYDAHHALLDAPINGKELFLVGATGGIWTINPNTTNWLTTMLSPGHLADKIDGIEVHDYIYFPDTVPSVGFSEDQYYDIVWRANEGQIAPRIRDIKTVLNREDPSGRIKIMEDEWGDWLMEVNPSDTWFQQVTLMDAISAAEHLHVFMEHADRVLMAGLAQSTNVIHSLFLTNSSSGGTDLVKTPAFHVFKMFVPHHVGGARWAPITLDSEDITGNGRSLPVISAGATVNDAGEVHLSLVNVDLTSMREVTVTIDSTQVGYAVQSAQVITGPAKDSYNDFGEAEAVSIQPLADTSYAICGRTLKVTLPSKSVVMLGLTPLTAGGV